MRAVSPDSDWRSPRFVMRRLAGLPTVDPAWFAPTLPADAVARISNGASAAARGVALRPATRSAMLLSPTPRSGTNFIEALIAAHPLVAISPAGLREVPALPEVDALAPFARRMVRRHASAAALGAEDWLALALAGLVNRAAAEEPWAELILLKDPHARRLDLLPAVLPHATPIIVLRDGPRTVDSAAATWRSRGLRRWLGRSFADHCREWALATTSALDFLRDAPGAFAVRYEDAVAAPSAMAARLWSALGLEADSEAERAAAVVPVLGSSTHSRSEAGVDWSPRAPAEDFDPAQRALEWSSRRHRIFEREAGPVQARLTEEVPVRAVSRRSGGREPASVAEGSPRDLQAATES